jgi:hypothetical protein
MVHTRMDSCEISAPQFATENGYNTYRIPFTVIQINLQSEYPAGELISDINQAYRSMLLCETPSRML